MARLNAAFDQVHGEAAEELQHADVMAGTNCDHEPGFEVAAEVGECGRELPVAVDRRVVERGGFAFQNHQKLQGGRAPFRGGRSFARGWR